MQTGSVYRRPVNHQTTDPVIPNHNVFNREKIEDFSPGLHCFCNQQGYRLNRTGGIVTGLKFAVTNAEFIEYPQALFLNNDLVKHHATAPHAAAKTQFTFKKSYFFTGFGKVVGSNQTSRPPANDNNIVVKMINQFFMITVNYCPGNNYFI